MDHWPEASSLEAGLESLDETATDNSQELDHFSQTAVSEVDEAPEEKIDEPIAPVVAIVSAEPETSSSVSRGEVPRYDSSLISLVLSINVELIKIYTEAMEKKIAVEGGQMGFRERLQCNLAFLTHLAGQSKVSTTNT